MRRIERRIVPRGYEMDATGTIPVGVIASYLEHARWESVVERDFPLRNYWRRGVIRAQRIEIAQRIRFGVEISVELWLGRVGRTSLDLAHRVTRVDTGEVVARAVATAVNLGPDGKPAPLDAGVEALLAPGEMLEPLPLEPSVSELAFKRTLVVCPSDQDVLQHVNHARYIDFVEDARFFAARAGAYAGRDEAAAAPVERLAIAYEREAAAGTELEVVTWSIAEHARAFGFEIRRADDGSIVSRARIETAR